MTATSTSTLRRDAVGTDQTPPRISSRPPGLWDDVELERDLRQAALLIQRVRTTFGSHETGRGSDQETGRNVPETVGFPFLSPTSPPVIRERQEPNSSADAKETDAKESARVAVASMVLGAVLLFLGLAFLAWGMVDEEANRWQPGLPLAMLGQAALTLGVALKLDWFGRTTR